MYNGTVRVIIGAQRVTVVYSVRATCSTWNVSVLPQLVQRVGVLTDYILTDVLPTHLLAGLLTA